MRGIARITFTILLLCTAAYSQQFYQPARQSWGDELKKPATIASIGVCFGGVTTDVVSSQHGFEINPLLANSTGRISNSRALLVGYSSCGTIMLLSRWKPRLARVLGFAVGGVHFGAAAHNWRN